MRRPRRKLEVNTFPFLAVLLCAMGSFILLLMVIDRRAKIATQNKARDAYLARKIAYEVERDERAAAAKDREAKLKFAWQMQKDKIHVELQAEEDALAQQITQVLAALAKTDDQVAGQKTTAASLAQKVSLEDAALKALQKEMQSRQNQVDQAKQTSQGHLKLREQLTRDLVLLETALRNVQERKSLDRPVYSLVPYKGKHGASGKPIYIEVSARSVAVHPGPMSLDAATWSLDALRRAIEERTGPLEKEVFRPGMPPVEHANNPYVLFLVRPSGIPRYYESLQALRGYRVDFGYELIEADWVFDFSDGKLDQQAWRNAAKIDFEPSNVTRPLPKGMGPRVLGSGGGYGGTGGLPTGAAGNAGLGSGIPGDAASSTGDRATLGPRVPGFAGGYGTGRSGIPSNFGGASGLPNGNPATGPGSIDDPRGQFAGPGGNGVPGTASFSPGGATGNIGGIGTGYPPNPPGQIGGGAPGKDGAPIAGNFGPGGATGYPNSSTSPIPGATGDPRAPSPIGQSGNGVPGAAAYGSGSASGSSGGNQGFPGASNIGRPNAGVMNSGGSSNPVSGALGGVPGSAGGAASNGNPGGQVGGNGDPNSPASGQPNGAGNSPNAGQGGGSGQAPGAPGGAAGGVPNLTFTLNDQKPDQPPAPRFEGTPPPRDNPLTFRDVSENGAAPKRTGPTNNSSNGGSIGDSAEPNSPGSGRPGRPGAAGESGGESGPSVGNSPFLQSDKSRPETRLPALGRIVGNRDFVMTVECYESKVTLSPPGKTFDLNDPSSVEQLANVMKTLVAGRQRTVRPGEPPYRPIVHFRVQADGRRTYYSVYPRIAEFGFPMSRETPD